RGGLHDGGRGAVRGGNLAHRLLLLLDDGGLLHHGGGGGGNAGPVASGQRGHGKHRQGRHHVSHRILQLCTRDPIDTMTPSGISANVSPPSAFGVRTVRHRRATGR